MMKLSMLSLCAAFAFSLPAFAAEQAAPENLFTLPLDAFQQGKQANQRVYLKPGVDLKSYHAVLPESLLFLRQAKNGQWELLKAGDENAIAAYYQQKLRSELAAAGVPIADAPAPGVVRLRVAMTSVEQDRPGVDAVDLLPIKAVFNLARLAAGKEPYLLKIGSMAQLEDSQDGSLLAGTVNLRQGGKSKTKEQQVSLDMLKPLMDDWCKQSAQQLASHLGKAQ
ncbi:DUF3313 domain-containing protein [Chromobacterium sp. IIBBL 290-4]|uniref:DUF3313 domain-containing protein n=1 Tax=Chromobacterium sp. IIBBL 290-4 TaxID=2953890 RepID=UPI0020B8FF63|nr:DUF3313 domain-containing protein [Chromobacterium sp. IIBBL 290-4]UTH73387.1 DUF3313 domain-containing protein [Chromobacterium sp. IIBBL 290-4]